MSTLVSTGARVRANILELSNVLLVLFILVSPWLKLEIFRRFTYSEVIFAGLLLVIFLQYTSGQKMLVRESAPPKQYWVVMAFWVVAILASGITAPFVGPFAFEAVAMIYLVLLSLVTIMIAGESEARLIEVIRWLRISLIGVVSVGVAGILYYIATSTPDLFFYSTSGKLIATFRAPNQLGGVLVLFFPFIWEEVLRKGAFTRKLFYGIILLALIACVVATGSRSAVAAVAFGLVMYGGLYALRVNIRMLALGGVLAIASFFAIQLVRGEVGVVGRALSVFSIETLQNGLTDVWRQQNWAVGFEMFLQHPINGFGLANIHIVNHHEIHSTYISILGEMGMVGALAATAIIGYLLFCCVQNMGLARILHNDRLTSISRALFVGSSMFLIYATQHQMFRSRYFWLVIGLIVATNLVLKQMIKRKNGGAIAAD